VNGILQPAIDTGMFIAQEGSIEFVAQADSVPNNPDYYLETTPAYGTLFGYITVRNVSLYQIQLYFEGQTGPTYTTNFDLSSLPMTTALPPTNLVPGGYNQSTNQWTADGGLSGSGVRVNTSTFYFTPRSTNGTGSGVVFSILWPN